MLWGSLTAVMLAIVVTAVFAPRWSRPASRSEPPILGVAPTFELVNRDGRKISTDSLRGTPWIANFIFTRCALSCPRMTERMIRLEGSAGRATLVRRVSFTVDPEFDTAEVLQSYADSWQITDPEWLFLTGPLEEIIELVRQGFRLGIDNNPASDQIDPREPILHSTRFVLVDLELNIRGYYDVVDAGELERLKRDLRAIVG